MHRKQMTQPTNMRNSLNKNSSTTTLQSINSIKRTLRNFKSSEKPIPALMITKKTLEVIKRDNLSSYEDFINKLKFVSSKQFPIPDSFTLIDASIKNRNKVKKEQPIANFNKTTSSVNKNNKSTVLDYEYIDFPILSQSVGYLTQSAIEIISKFGLEDSVSGKYVLKKVVKQISNGYNTLAYHNFSHAFSLLHMLYHLLKIDSAFRMLYNKQQITFVLIAALAHDLNHQGTNNGFQVKNNSQLAKIAQNDAVLQKMHVRTFFNILKSKNILLMEKSKNPIQMKKLITRVILATDVSKHFAGVQKLKKLSKQNQFNANDRQHRYFMMQQAFHACDIGNPCLQYNQYISWAALLSYEFNTQTVLQQRNKVEITAMLKYKGIKGFYQGQIGFINALVLPLWKQLTVFWPNFNSLVEKAESNLTILTSNVKQLDTVDQQK